MGDIIKTTISFLSYHEAVEGNLINKLSVNRLTGSHSLWCGGGAVRETVFLLVHVTDCWEEGVTEQLSCWDCGSESQQDWCVGVV